MKIGDLVQSTKFEERIGVVVEIFGDLNPEDPWIRIQWTFPQHSFEWCKQGGLKVVGKNTKTSK